MKNIFVIFLIAGVLLAGSAMAEVNPGQVTGTRESGQVNGRNEMAMGSKVALSGPVKEAVPDTGVAPKEVATLKTDAVPNAEATPKTDTVSNAETAPKTDALPNAEVTPKTDVLPNAEVTPKTDAVPNTEAAPDAETAREEAEIEAAAEEVTIADPIEPVNRAIFQFNDKFYFWLLKPAAQGYNFVVPEPVRVSVKNFFKNVAMPIRFVNSLLQGKFKGAGNELARFGINTTIGLVGFFDVAKSRFDIMPQERDLGQTLGVYGMGGLMYIVWPFLGPSTVRETIGLAGDSFMYPVSYIEPFEAAIGVGAYERLNKTSLTLGDYEDMKAASVEPYIGVRDAYIQYRKGLIKK